MATLHDLRQMVLDESGSKKKGGDLTTLQKVGIIAGATVAAPFVLTYGLVSMAIYCAYKGITRAIKGEKTYLEIAEGEFNEIIDEMEKCRNDLLAKQKGHKQYQSVYRHHAVDGFVAFSVGKINRNVDIKGLFKSGKQVNPDLNVAYWLTDGIENYIELWDKAPDKAAYASDDVNFDYFAAAEELAGEDMVTDLISLGFKKDNKVYEYSDKYPNVRINYKITGDIACAYIYPKKGYSFKKASESSLKKLRDLARH